MKFLFQLIANEFIVTIEKKAMNKTDGYLTIFAGLILLFAWGFFLYRFGPEKIIQLVGIQNSYIAAFLIAVIGGTSVFTTASFYMTIATFAAGGLNIFALALISGMGVAIGDSFFFFLGTKGRKMTSSAFRKKLNKFSGWLQKLPGWVIPIFAFAYAGFVPLPNDALMISLALGKYKFLRVIPFVFLGDLALMLTISFLAQKGLSFV